MGQDIEAIRLRIVELPTPERHDVVLAKSYILRPGSIKGEVRQDEAIAAYCDEAAIPAVKEVVIHENADTEGMVKGVAERFRAETAFARAVWELTHEGFLAWFGGMATRIPRVGYTTVFEKSGGRSGGWEFKELEVPIPPKLFKPNAWKTLDHHHGRTGPFSLEESIGHAHIDVQDGTRRDGMFSSGLIQSRRGHAREGQ